MPNRILREGILTSPKIALLEPEEELFYRKLHSVVDDFGRYHADPMLLRASCYPRRLDKVTDKMVSKWLTACVAARLVSVYVVDDQPYLEVLDFRQQTRAKSKFPQPPSTCIANAAQPIADAQQLIANAHLDVVVFGGVDGVVDMSGKPDASPPAEKPPDPKTEARAILEFLNTKTGRAYQPVDANLDFVVARLKEGATPAQCRQVIAKKAREWLGDEKMAEYLRPATLFNKTKFAQYVGELVP